MVRWVALLALVVSATANARAKIVIMDPPIVRACPRAASWEGVDKCLRKHGTPTILRTIPNARLVQLQQKSGETSYDGGVYLYIQRGNEWKLAGLYSNRGGEYELLGFETLKVGAHVGYRVDVGQVFRTVVQPDGFTNLPAVFITHEAMLCGGDTWRCTEVVTACDVLVRGGALWSFRGNVQIADNQIKITGDRTHVGPFCAVSETEFLGWSQTKDQ